MEAGMKKKDITIGLVVPYATDALPEEGPKMYPRAHFIPKGVGVEALTPEGFRSAWDNILPAARELAAKGVDALMVIGTSLTFHRGYEEHQNLLHSLREETGLPVSTMAEAVIDGLRSVGGKRIAVATAYGDEVNHRLADFLRTVGFEVLAVKGFGITAFDSTVASKSEEEIITLSAKAIAEAGDADAVLISCGGLRTLGVAASIERRHAIPVVTSTQSAFWKAMQLAGDSGYFAGHGRMLEGSGFLDADHQERRT
jgi:arylmalonate decarboxylase